MNVTIENVSNQVIDESLTQSEHDELKALVTKWLDEGLTLVEANRMNELESREWGL